jgi:5-methylcytosine-specific restriction protein A
MPRAATICAADHCPNIATHAGRCDRHQLRQVEGRARRRRYDRLACRDGLRCAGRGATNVPLIQSHDVPLVRGGRDVDGNLKLLCGPCHAEHNRANGIGFGGAAVGRR